MVFITNKKTLFMPIKTKRTFEEVSKEIKKLIFKGVFKPGDKLPSESEIARQFNVGRQTVREALRLLELSGFITIQRGSTGGPFIENTILNTITNSFLDAFSTKQVTINELVIVRLEIEKALLNYIFLNVDDSDIKSLEENILQTKKDLELKINPYKNNIEFHKLLAKASKNQVFVILTESIMAVIADFLSRLEPKFEVSKNTLIEHEDILNAIKEKNRNKAMILIEKHILRVGEDVKDLTRTPF